MRGFTLLELMVVVAIASIMSAMAIPNISVATRRQKTLAETADIERFLLGSRDTARVKNRCVELRAAGDRLVRTTYENCTGIEAAFYSGTTPTVSDVVRTKELVLDKMQIVSVPTVIYLPSGAIGSSAITTMSFTGAGTSVSFNLWPASGAVERN